MVLTGLAAPVALVILASISLQIFLFHAVLRPTFGEQILPLIMIAAHVAAAIRFRPACCMLFTRQRLMAEAKDLVAIPEAARSANDEGRAF